MKGCGPARSTFFVNFYAQFSLCSTMHAQYTRVLLYRWNACASCLVVVYPMLRVRYVIQIEYREGCYGMHMAKHVFVYNCSS